MIVGRYVAVGKERAVVNRLGRELGLILAWLAFPLVPVVLADFCYQTCNPLGPDPHDRD